MYNKLKIITLINITLSVDFTIGTNASFFVFPICFNDIDFTLYIFEQNSILFADKYTFGGKKFCLNYFSYWSTIRK